MFKFKRRSFITHLSICLILVLAVAILPVNTFIVRAYDSAVIPINWSSFSAGNPSDGFALQVVSALKNANKYAVNTWYNVKKNYDAQGGTYLDFGGTAEGNIRPPVFEAEALAIAVKTGVYDAAYTGVSLTDARNITLKLIRSVAYRHKVNTAGGWGGGWQTAQWAGVAGHAGFMMWGDLSATDREYVRKMVEYEANRFNLSTPPHSDPVNKDSGDTYAEETAWNTNAIGLAAAMMPNHANYQTWMYRFCLYSMQAAMRQSDNSSNYTIINGKAVRDWTAGWDMLENGSVINHAIIHPDYMGSVANGRMLSAFALTLAGRQVPKAALFNTEIIYDCLVDYNFTTPTYWSPGGTIFIDGTSNIYYPEGNDWGTGRRAHFAAIDAYADAFGLDSLVGQKGSYWGPLHVQKVLEMQNRFTDGYTYLNSTEDSYSGREEWVANFLARAYLTKWLKHQNAISITNADFSSPSWDLLFDDFEDGDSNGWTPVNGSWSVVTDGGKVYRQAGTGGEGLVIAGIPNWRDYFVTSKVKITGGTNSAAGIIGRYADSNNYYMLRLHEDLDKIQIYKKVGGLTTLLGEQAFTVNTDTWYTLKLDMCGTVILGYVDGAQKISIRDSSLTNGYAGARTYNTSASYDDFGAGHN